MARQSKLGVDNTARSLGLMLANVGGTYIVLSRSSESVYRALREGGRQLLDIHLFPSDITLAVSYVTAVLIALIGSRFTWQRLVLTYAACLAWAVGIHFPLQTRWDYEIVVDGRINSKVQMIVFGVLLLWVASWWHERLTGGSDRGSSSDARSVGVSSGWAVTGGAAQRQAARPWHTPLEAVRARLCDSSARGDGGVCAHVRAAGAWLSDMRIEIIDGTVRIFGSRRVLLGRGEKATESPC